MVKFIPIKIDDQGYPSIAEGNDRTEMIALMQRLSSHLGTIIQVDDQRVICRSIM